MFPDDAIPQVSPARGGWVCSKCGNEDQAKVRTDPSRPSVDPRYAIGYCDDCTPARRSVKGLVRDHVPLVHVKHWQRRAFLARREAEADAKLLGRYRRGHHLNPEEVARVKELVQRREA